VQLKMKKESLTAWTSVDLDNILCCGDYLYKEIYKACRLQGDYLHPSNIPCHLQWENVVFGYKIMSKKICTLVESSLTHQYKWHIYNCYAVLKMKISTYWSESLNQILVIYRYSFSFDDGFFPISITICKI
jgi:hypothetical protein